MNFGNFFCILQIYFKFCLQINNIINFSQSFWTNTKNFGNYSLCYFIFESPFSIIFNSVLAILICSFLGFLCVFLQIFGRYSYNTFHLPNLAQKTKKSKFLKWVFHLLARRILILFSFSIHHLKISKKYLVEYRNELTLPNNFEANSITPSHEEIV